MWKFRLTEFLTYYSWLLVDTHLHCLKNLKFMTNFIVVYRLHCASRDDESGMILAVLMYVFVYA
jgi:hypothetical protein